MNENTEVPIDEPATWKPAEFNFKASPSLATKYSLNDDQENSNNFARSAKWSPDGTTLLCHCENNTFWTFYPNVRGLSATQFQPATLPQPSPILDFIWYPTASPYDPASFCFVASVRECPVKLLDANDGRLRASYKIVDHRERQVAPHSLAFNLTAQKLYCGFEDTIEIFDVARPGEGIRQHTTPSKKSKDGLKGIVSALAFSPSYNGGESLYAAGTFSPNGSNIAMCSDEREEPLFLLGGGPYAGVTQLQFNPMRPHLLYAAYRGQGTGLVYSWDVRSDLEQPVNIFKVPPVSSTRVTNQKFRFDIDIAGRFLSIGDQSGKVSIFNLDESSTSLDTENAASNKTTLPNACFGAHEDAVGSVAIHPVHPLISTVSGSRHFLSYDSDSDSSEDGVTHPPCPVVKDASIKVWDFSPAPSAQ
ncbi:hypothetical protein BJ165DRAFT_1451124 [Panaeolus papilionaceus]|nr:hypothetical protein BJ165DRAFT_1451124 [Panaeolus papilionaceus]